MLLQWKFSRPIGGGGGKVLFQFVSLELKPTQLIEFPPRNVRRRVATTKRAQLIKRKEKVPPKVCPISELEFERN